MESNELTYPNPLAPPLALHPQAPLRRGEDDLVEATPLPAPVR
jgi:hypothetical protein